MSIQAKNLRVWFNGQLRNHEDCTVSVRTHALHYGSSVFEGIRAYDTPLGTRVFGLQDHLKRLFWSASIYRIPTPYSLDERHAACRETVKASGLKSAYLRPVVFRGDCGPGVIPKNMSVVDVAIMLAADLGLQVQEKPISREQMYAADEMFFTGTAVEVTPVKQLDHLKAGTGTKGLVTTTLQSAFFGLFDGRTTDQRGWLEPLWTRP